MKIFSVLTVCILVTAMIGCTKNVIEYGEAGKISAEQPRLKINYVSMYANNRSVYFKINDKRVSYVMTARTPFPGGGYNTGGSSAPDYLAVDAGTIKLSVFLPRKIDDGTDSLELYSTTLQIAAGRSYVAHITDTAAATKTYLTEENLVRPDTSISRYRFVNLMPNVTTVDLYHGISATDHTKDTLIAGNVPYLNMTKEITLKSLQTRTWKIRTAGAALTTATVLASYTSASTFLNQRVYTIFASGYSGKTTTVQRPYVAFFLIK
jgi:hypothetical protein